MTSDSSNSDAVRDWERAVYRFLDEPIPETVRERGATTVADVLAATVAGSAVPDIRDAATDGQFADGTARVLGSGRAMTPTQAALVNGTAAIAQEIEEGHDTGGHVGAGIVAGGLAAAEAADCSGETFVDACVRSYEVCVRVERAIFAMKDRINDAVPWLVRDPHSTWTTIGPALTAAQCLGLGADRPRETFRVAANLAVVSMHDPYAEGPPARNVTAGVSAQAGVTAALLADAGLAGSEAAIGAVYDPFEDLLEEGFRPAFETLGEDWEITRNYFKPYPSCRYTHPPLDALRDAGPVDGEVASVTVRTFENATDMAHASPETMTSAKFSTPYVLARYLVSGSVSLEHFSPEAIADPEIQALADRVSLAVDPEFEAAFPEKWGAAVTVELADGRNLEGSCAVPRGDYRRPISDEEYRERTQRLLEWGLESEADAATAHVALDDLLSRSVRDVVDALSV